jgi:hypothetical protein
VGKNGANPNAPDAVMNRTPISRSTLVLIENDKRVYRSASTGWSRASRPHGNTSPQVRTSLIIEPFTESTVNVLSALRAMPKLFSVPTRF